jgi:hypothetical protein
LAEFPTTLRIWSWSSISDWPAVCGACWPTEASCRTPRSSGAGRPTRTPAPKQVTDAAGEDLRQPEVLVRAVADVTLTDRRRDLGALRRAVGPRWWHPRLSPAVVDLIDTELRSVALAWDRVAPAASLERTWHPTKPR